MAELLTESGWAGFTKKLKADLDDAALVKALARLDKAPAGKPEARQEALRALVDEIRKQVTALGKRKKDLGDKVFGEAKDKLYALLDAAETAQKDAQRSAEAEGDDEEEGPALLTTKLLPLIREVRKGELVLQALVAVAGKETVLLLSRKAISPARGKLLKEQMTNPAGLKFIRGDCRFEQNALTFVVQAPAGGLARKIKEALLGQTGLRLKVRVRGEDGEESDGEESEGQGEAVPAVGEGAASQSEGAGSQGAAAASDTERVYRALRAEIHGRLEQAVRAGHAEAAEWNSFIEFADYRADEKQDYATATQSLNQLKMLLDGLPQAATEPAAPVDPGAAFNARLAALLPLIKQAIAGGVPAGQDVKLKVSEAGVFARKRNFDEAHRLLDEAEALLRAAGLATDPADPEGEPAGAGGPKTFVGYAKARLAWLDTRKQVAAELQRLERAILQAYAGSSSLGAVQTATRSLDEVLTILDERLADKLDEGLNAADPAARQAIHRQAAEIIGRYQRFIRTSPLMRQVDDNPFVAVNVQERLSTTLDDLERQLA